MIVRLSTSLKSQIIDCKCKHVNKMNGLLLFLDHFPFQYAPPLKQSKLLNFSSNKRSFVYDKDDFSLKCFVLCRK